MADTQDLIPAGWMLVPVEPTREMMEAMPMYPSVGAPGDIDLIQAGWALGSIKNRHRWLGALAAAPAAPAQPAPASREPLTFDEWWESAGPNTVSVYETAKSTWEFLVAHGFTATQHKEGSAQEQA